jgi:hypothetical protein
MSQPQVTEREVSAMSEDFYNALAIGDRGRAGGIVKKLIERIGKIDPDNLKGALDLFRKLLDSGMVPNSQPLTAQSESGITALAHDDLLAAGITDNVALWVEFVTLLFEFIRRIRGGQNPSPAGLDYDRFLGGLAKSMSGDDKGLRDRVQKFHDEAQAQAASLRAQESQPGPSQAQGRAELERHYPQGNQPGTPVKEGGSPESSPQHHPPKSKH